MAFVYIDWHKNETIPYWNDIYDEWSCTEFFEEGDDYLVFHNTDNNEYAVYLKLGNNGGLCSLVQHFDLFSRLVDNDDGLSDELYGVIRQKAIDKGFPEHWNEINRTMTWRTLINELQVKYKDVLDDPAQVWVPQDADFDEFSFITGVSPYHLGDTPGFDHSNPVSINLQEA